jgi:hypothetical protein
MKVQVPISVAILAAAAAFPVLAAATKPGTLVCGGIGADERAELSRHAHGANVALELFVARHGDYVAGADLAIVPLEGRAHGEAVRATADGPLCYMRLAPGRYRIEAELDGVMRSARVTVPEHAHRPVRVALAFPATAARGDLDIRPTPQEREEARRP